MPPADAILDDHDQRFKALIREFFGEFLQLFFADWARRFDLTTVEWLDTELLPDPPDGGRHRLDLVARLRAREPIEPGTADWLALVHIEVESPDRTTALKPRLPAYYLHLKDRYGLPVLPVVLYLKVGLDGIGTDAVVDRFWELEVLRLQYLYVGLPGLDAEPYATGDNWLGVALSALMRIPPGKASDLGLQALRRIAGAGLTEQQSFLLSECVEAYLPVDDARLAQMLDIIAKDETGRAPTMQRNRTRYDRALEQGRAEGLEQGVRKGRLEILEAQLECRFGAPSPETLAALRALPDDRLRQLVVAIPKANSLADLGL